MSWLAPAGLGFSLVTSEFERCALPIYLQIEAQGKELGEKLAKILDKYKDQPLSEENASEKITTLHLNDTELTYRFSKYMKAYEDNKVIAKKFVSSVLELHNVMIVHSKDDTYSHFSESVQLDKQFDNVRLELQRTGGHLQLFKDAELLAKIVSDYIESCSTVETTEAISSVI